MRIRYAIFCVIFVALLVTGCAKETRPSEKEISYPPANDNQNTVFGKELSGRWTGTLKEELHGPEGSFPPGCNVEQAVLFEFSQSGSVLSGTTTNTVTKINGCSPIMPSSLIGMMTTAKLSGTVSGSSATFSYEDRANLGAADFTATFSEDTISGKVETCHSPDKRCSCNAPDPRCPGGFNKDGMPAPGELKTVNWWTGDFTATRTK